MTRMFVAAMAAVGLSVGGYEIGSSRTGPPPPSVVVDVPADHPISVALQSPISSAVDNQERMKLVEMAHSYRADEVRARKAAADQTVQLMNPLSPERNEGSSATMRLAQVRRDVENQLATQKVNDVNRKYTDMVLQQMEPKISKRVKEVVSARRDMDEERGFGLLLALRSRDELQLTPQQVTKLQLLQADFIRRFAPIREAYETRVDDLRWKYDDGLILAKPKVFTTNDAKKGQVKVEYFVESKALGADGKDVKFWVYPRAANEKSGGPVVFNRELVLKDSKGKGKTAVIRYFVWTSDESLESQLQSLKKEIDGKVKKVLNETQQRQLQEKIDQSMAAGK